MNGLRNRNPVPSHWNGDGNHTALPEERIEIGDNGMPRHDLVQPGTYTSEHAVSDAPSKRTTVNPTKGR